MEGDERGGGSIRIDEREIERLEELARLRLSEVERKGITAHMVRMVEYFGMLKEADVSGREPLFHPLELRNVLRADDPREGLDTEEALRNASERNASFFVVPRVMKRGSDEAETMLTGLEEDARG